jgi:rubredoxin
MLWKCSVCGFMHEGNEAPDVCPKCGASKEKFAAMPEEDANKVFSADRTNDIHMEIIGLAMKIKDLAREGIELNLDPPCVAVFQQAHDEAWVMKQRSKAELAGHVARGKW